MILEHETHAECVRLGVSAVAHNTCTHRFVAYILHISIINKLVLTRVHLHRECHWCSQTHFFSKFSIISGVFQAFLWKHEPHHIIPCTFSRAHGVKSNIHHANFEPACSTMRYHVLHNIMNALTLAYCVKLQLH